MTEVDVEKSSLNQAPSKDVQAIVPPSGNKDAGDANDRAKPVDVKSNETIVEKDNGDGGGGPKPDVQDGAATAETKQDENGLKSGGGARRGPFRPYRYGLPFRGNFRILHENQRRRDEQQQEKTVVQKEVNGKVKWYSFRRNFGFIQRDDDQKDVFVHQLSIAKSRIRKPTLRTLGPGESVQFDVVQGKQGLEASNVTGPNGTDVQGSRIIFIFNNAFDPRFDRQRLPYFNNDNYGRQRPAYYGNYAPQRPNYFNRDVGRQRDDRFGFRYDGGRRPYANNRERPAFRDEKLYRQPYRPRSRVIRGRLQTTETRKEENTEKKGAADADAKDQPKANKNGIRRVRGGRQYRRKNHAQKTRSESTTVAPSDATAKETADTKPTEQDETEKKNIPEDVIQGISAIQV